MHKIIAYPIKDMTFDYQHSFEMHSIFSLALHSNNSGPLIACSRASLKNCYFRQPLKIW